MGLFLTSFRSHDQIVASGWWSALSSSTRNDIHRAPAGMGEVQADGRFAQKGNVLGDGSGQVIAFGTSSLAPEAFKPGETADLGNGRTLSINSAGAYVLRDSASFQGKRGQRMFFTATVPPALSAYNYRRILVAGGLGRAFLNSVAVAVPSTIVPILLAAFAAFGLAWMQFPGRALLTAGVVGLLVVPLQVVLIPLLTIQNAAGQTLGFDSRSYIWVWLAHTGFALPLAVYLLRNAMAGLPREIMEAARVDGATDFQIFVQIALPLSFPALASFAIFQFLWTWNDLIVALVFLGPGDDKLVLTGYLVNLLGSRGGEWDILAASAFVSIAVPMLVFFSLQKFLVRGLLAGCIK